MEHSRYTVFTAVCIFLKVGKQLHIMVTDADSGIALSFYTEQEGDWIEHARCEGRGHGIERC